jgi:hypothetical protein
MILLVCRSHSINLSSLAKEPLFRLVLKPTNNRAAAAVGHLWIAATPHRVGGAVPLARRSNNWRCLCKVTVCPALMAHNPLRLNLHDRSLVLCLGKRNASGQPQ